LTPFRLRMAEGSGLGHGENAPSRAYACLALAMHIGCMSGSRPARKPGYARDVVGMTVRFIAVVIAAAALRGR
jgi:hypothetical protein